MPNNREEVFYVRVALTGPPERLARAVKYAKENVGRATSSLLADLGVASSVTNYRKGALYERDSRVIREQSVQYGDAEEAPLELQIKEMDE